MRFYVAHMMEADLEEVVEIEEIAALSRWGYQGYRSDLLHNPLAVMLVARGDEPAAMLRRVLGFVVGRVVPSPFDSSQDLHINNIAVHPDYRRYGVGHALMEEALALGRMYGARMVRLEVRASNNGAQRLYADLNFKVATRRRSYYSSPTEDALVMERNLTE